MISKLLSSTKLYTGQYVIRGAEIRHVLTLTLYANYLKPKEELFPSNMRNEQYRQSDGNHSHNQMRERMPQHRHRSQYSYRLERSREMNRFNEVRPVSKHVHSRPHRSNLRRDEYEALSDVSSGTLSEPEAGEIKSDEEDERIPSKPSSFDLESVKSGTIGKSPSYSPHTPPLPPKAYESFSIHVESHKRKASNQVEEDEERKFKKKKRKEQDKQ
ncbi:unnamed protein product [Allacma fusca]|uniref:Uncharacterized protein n=1 Tax=Allacma fusca TaxID=39272 RepID=A0A8J2NW27_9HEXA|nr:unnamed protein product [Allacma fusca]